MTPAYLLCCALFFQSCGAFVILQQNGFNGLHVFVSPSVSINDWKAVKDGLIDAFTKTSETMYYGTGGRSYFREYTVIVPPAWEHQDGWNGYIQQNDLESEMTIHSLSDSVSLYDGFPYVDHSRKCNANGDMMHFPSTYFTGDNKAGDVDKLMLKTWMSYRYGMFDELGYPQDSKHPAVYCEANGTRTATQCSNVPLTVGESGKTFVSIRGQNGDCNCAKEGNLLNCLYLPLVDDAQPEELYSSIMGFHHIYKIQTFCDTDSGFYFHDKESRNLQNTLCERPTMDTMLEHYDFQHGHNAPDYVEDLVPKVSIYQHRTNIVFVLDTNGNIAQDTGSLVKSVLSEWMLDHALYMHVGIVAVSGPYHGAPNQHFTIISEVMHLTNQSLIDTMINQTQGIKYTRRGSWNQIDEGLRHSIEMVDVMDGIIVWISDGSENEGDLLQCCQSVIKEKNIHIVAIDIGKENRSQIMIDLTQQCNQDQGMYFYAGQNPLLVHNALDTTARTFSYPQQSKRVKILSSMKIAGEFWIDGDLDSVEITFHVLTTMNITKDMIKLLHNDTADGVEMDFDSGKYPKIVHTIDVGQNPAMCGKWSYNVSFGQGSIGVYVTGISKHMNRVNNVDCQVLTTMVNGNPQERRILAKPVKSNKPLINARVSYTLNDGEPNYLFDDGEKGMDAIKNDGVYTTILKDEIEDDTTIQCIVNGKEDTFAHPGFQKWYDAFGETVQRPLCCGNEAPLPDNKNITGKFTRIAISNYYKA